MRIVFSLLRASGLGARDRGLGYDPRHKQHVA
jgi:hypothetical protein